MTKNDLKTGVIYIEDNGWNSIYYIKLYDGNFLFIDLDDQQIFIDNDIVDDGFDVNPPEEKQAMKNDFIKYVFEIPIIEKLTR